MVRVLVMFFKSCLHDQASFHFSNQNAFILLINNLENLHVQVHIMAVTYFHLYPAAELICNQRINNKLKYRTLALI